MVFSFLKINSNYTQPYTRGKTTNILLSYLLPVDLHDVPVARCSASVMFIALLLFLVSECACLTDLNHLPRSFQPWLIVLGCSSLQRDSGQTTGEGRKREGEGTWRRRECERQRV